MKSTSFTPAGQRRKPPLAAGFYPAPRPPAVNRNRILLSASELPLVVVGTLTGKLGWSHIEGNGIERAYCSIRVTCPHCHKQHSHGWDVGDLQPQHRVADCGHLATPTSDMGYYIRPALGDEPGTNKHAYDPHTVLLRQRPAKRNGGGR